MDDKENIPRFLKRRSSVFNDDTIMAKKQALHSGNHVLSLNTPFEETPHETVNQNPKTIASTCLTSNFKSRCQLNYLSDNCGMPMRVSTPEDQIVSLAEFKKLPKPIIRSDDSFDSDRPSHIESMRISTPEDQIVSLAEFKKLPKPIIRADDSIDSDRHSYSSGDGTPADQVLPLADFKKLPKPDILLSNCSLNKSVTDSYASDTSLALDCSFEIVKYSLHRSRSHTTASVNFNPTFLTPETPCDINDIDLEPNVAVVSQLPALAHVITSKMRKNLMHCSISPMFYENAAKPTKRKKIVVQQRTRAATDDAAGQMDAEFLDDNRIEEFQVDQVDYIIRNDFTSDSYAFHIIDCRYPYEYAGGHVSSAVNLYTPWQMLNYVFLSQYDINFLRQPLVDTEESLKGLLKTISEIDRPGSNWKYQAFIFHCEFSSIRGPEMARCMRNVDRWANLARYPQLYFPKVCIMKKGYKEFYRRFKCWCQPCSYVPMDIKDPNCTGDDVDRSELDDSIDENSLNAVQIDEETRKRQVDQYNACKKETQEQMKLLSKLMNDYDFECQNE